MKHHTTFQGRSLLLLQLVNLSGFGLFVVSASYVWFMFSSIPLKVPIDFGVRGESIELGSRVFLLFLPLLIGILAVGLYWLEKYPSYHKNPHIQLTSDQQRETKQMVCLLVFIRTMLFLFQSVYIWQSIQMAIGNDSNLEGMLWVFVILMIAIPTIMSLSGIRRA